MGSFPSARLPRWLAAGAAVAVVLGAVGFGGYELGASNRTISTAATQAIPTPPSGAVSTNSLSSGRLNVSAIVAKVDPAVVDITATDAYQHAVSAGTGMVLTSNGEVLTNNHVIAGATSITAQIDGRGPKYTAIVIGTDPTHDVALIQLQGVSGLPTVAVGNSAGVKVGESVVAIGNALDLPGSPTVTDGIVSALNRSITASNQLGGNSENLSGLLQTDAPLSPGNSGGPLVNSSGQVIGMNTAAATGGTGQSASNIGFAIPINRALSIASQIQKGQSSSSIQIGQPAFLGVDVEDVASAQGGYFGGYTPPVSSGALVVRVVPGTPAAGAGLVAGDVITTFGGQGISTVAALSAAISADHVGQSVSVGWVGPSGSSHSASITLVAGPAA
ncbi:MAG: S1C family serine protease [Candidatus Dormibacteria bacterium]